MYRIVLGIQYDGSKYNGWQTQLHKNTIQDIIIISIKKFLNINKINLYYSSRTDKGVHAIEQIAHFDFNLKYKNFKLKNGLNFFLPSYIIILWIKQFNLKYLNNFHSRYSTINKTYCYILCNNKFKSPFLNKKVLWVEKLNIYKINKSINYLIGTNDYISFTNKKKFNTIKTINFIKIYKNKNFIFFYFNGNGFLYHMIRNIITILILIGKKKIKPEIINFILKKKNNFSYNTSKPDGLYLLKINYSVWWNLPNINI